MTENRDFASLRFANKDEARAWLSNRYDEQVQLNPRLAVRFTKEFYVRKNLAGAMKMTIQTEQEEFWDGPENAERREILHQVATAKAMFPDQFVNIGDRVMVRIDNEPTMTVTTVYGKVSDTFGTACEITTDLGARVVVSRSECMVLA